ncbi:hypothetical protein KI809_11700 [Geobacter pelophilus]|uniref:Translocation and assembly module TamB n=1 Tax=Geoanaerobacter pelophilus TaxID=60036 RepID=A0AAW4L5Y7_9BACT|nr:hypothetical protein [Geoanaerobacter pelophilus]MBT0664962.1 hypothetical protein [Geoanaerobacter pelophilus]
MTGAVPKANKIYFACKVLSGLVLTLFVLVLCAVVTTKTYLASPAAAARISSLLTNKLALPTQIVGIQLRGDTLMLTGVRVGNPVGHTGSPLLTINTLSISPGWTQLLRGRRALGTFTVDGIKLNLQKQADGGWNIDPIRKRFSGGKGATELSIKDLKINNGDFLVNGKGITGLSFRLKNLATKGSADSSASLAFDDAAGNRYLGEGSFRLGNAPRLDFSLSAPSLNLDHYVGALNTGGFRCSGGNGKLQVKLGLQHGVVQANAAAAFSHLKVRNREGREGKFSGTMTVAAAYNIKGDSCRLENITCKIDEMLSLRASGRLDSLKSGMQFNLDLGIDKVDLNGFAGILPGMGRGGTTLGGMVKSEKIKLAGGVKTGVTALSGSLLMRDLRLTRGNRNLVSGVNGDIVLAALADGFAARGKLLQENSRENTVLETVNAPFTIQFSRSMKPQLVALPKVSARVLGISLQGGGSFRPLDKEPLAVTLQLPETSVVTLNAAVGANGSKLEAGTAKGSLTLSGAGFSDFAGSAALQLRGLKGRKGSEPFAVAEAMLQSSLRRTGGQLSAAGTARIDKASFKGAAAGGRFDFRVAENMLYVEKSEMRFGDSVVRVAELAIALPRKGGIARPAGYPLQLQLSGADIRHGQAELTGVSGVVSGSYFAGGSGLAIEGTAGISARQVVWRGKELGAPEVKLTFSQSAWNGMIAGKALGGTLAGGFVLNPQAVSDGVRFNLALKQAELVQMSQLLDKKASAALTGGYLDLAASGFAGQRDINCRLQGKAVGISVVGAGGKGLLENAGLQFDSTISKSKVSLADALISVGEGVRVQLGGEINDPFAPTRYGEIICKLNRTPLAKIADPLANSLPRLLQEAALSGEMGVDGKLTLRNGQQQFAGAIHLENAGIDAAAQHVKISGINGLIPLAVDLAARSKSPQQRPAFRREEFDQRLRKFIKPVADASKLTVSKISFGPLELGETTAFLKAANGVTDLLSLTSSLSSGSLLGTGYLNLAGGVAYGGEVTVNGLSLQQLCALFPKIKGYVSGRIDGIVELDGGGGGLKAMNGFTYFRAREGEGEKMLVSREFLQKLAGKNLQGFFFRDDRPYDRGEVKAALADGYLSFETLDISHTNFFGIRDLSVSVAEAQNRIALEHLFDSIRQAASRGKAATSNASPAEPAPATEFKWEE